MGLWWGWNVFFHPAFESIVNVAEISIIMSSADSSAQRLSIHSSVVVFCLSADVGGVQNLATDLLSGSWGVVRIFDNGSQDFQDSLVSERNFFEDLQAQIVDDHSGHRGVQITFNWQEKSTSARFSQVIPQVGGCNFNVLLFKLEGSKSV